MPEYSLLLGVLILGAGVSVPQLRDGVRNALEAVHMVQASLPAPATQPGGGQPPGPGGGLVFSYAAPATPFMPTAPVHLAPDGETFPSGTVFASANLPAGFALDSGTGAITGPGGTSGVFSAQVTAKMPDGRTSTATVTWEVLEEVYLSYPGLAQPFVVGQPIPPVIPVTNVTGGIWTTFAIPAIPPMILATGFPPGITFDSATGTLTGTPTQAGSYQVYIFVQDKLGDDARTDGGEFWINVQ